MNDTLRTVASADGMGNIASRSHRSFAEDTWRSLSHNSSGRIGMGLLALLLAISLLAPILAPANPLAQDIAIRLQPPTAAHWFGTDELGRDTLSRVLYGGRLLLGVGILAVAIGLVLGSAIGLIAGGQQGTLDAVLMRLMDILLAFPSMLLAIAIVAVRGPGLSILCLRSALSVFPTTRA